VADITLLSERQAHPGFVFTYLGAAPACKTCPYRNACLTLEAGRQYEVVRVRPVSHPCALQETEAKVVEVAPRPRRLLVEADAALVGATVEVGRTPCSRMDCPNWDPCAGPGLPSRQKFRIQVVAPERATCLIGRNLKVVEAL
jgi:uncharacterized protein (UPF0179 family)